MSKVVPQAAQEVQRGPWLIGGGTLYREMLNEKLGFSSAKTLGIDLDEMVTLEDMEVVGIRKTECDTDKAMNAQNIIFNQKSRRLIFNLRTRFILTPTLENVIFDLEVSGFIMEHI